MKRHSYSPETGIKIFLVISALVGLAMGLSDALFANYFKEAYDINAQQRGFIEIPRELPGILSVLFIAALSRFGNVRSAVAAQIMSLAGMAVLGFSRPEYSVMLFFLFIYSSGVHMYIPLGDSIGLSLSTGNNMGRTLGRFNSLRMAFLMFAGVATFLGFKTGIFSFEVPVTVFIVSAVSFGAVALLLLFLYRTGKGGGRADSGLKFVFRREYLRYYVICALFGGRKQIMLVYSPWVLIDLLDFKADTMSILAVIGALIGIFFMPVVGKWIDRYSVRNVMMAEALAFIFVYVAYGLLSRWVDNYEVALTGFGMMMVYLLNIIDRMSAQFAMTRAIYMRSIALAAEDVTPSLTLGMAIDHVVAIIGASLCGSVWFIWGPEYVFILAGAMSLMNLIAAMGIRSPELYGPRL
ncbi:MAG: MFS transporter [Clostridiales Family XIII bacterium]|jgi:predicted MFS family arabinose efflux permease|nr:MFS transporter [Clostridiales Family XIII bacterium]